MKSGCSAGRLVGGHSAEAPFICSCHQTSRPAFISTASLVRRTTRQLFTVGVSASGASTFALSGTDLPRRQPPSAVMQSFAPQSLMRSRSASAEKPPKTTVCVAPMRAQASMAIAASGIIGR